MSTRAFQVGGPLDATLIVITQKLCSRNQPCHERLVRPQPRIGYLAALRRHTPTKVTASNAGNCTLPVAFLLLQITVRFDTTESGWFWGSGLGTDVEGPGKLP